MSFMGGKERNKHNDKRSHVQGPSGKDVVFGMKDRKSNKVAAKRVSNRDKETVRGFLSERMRPSRLRSTQTITKATRGFSITNQ